jgi:hypothetical protein
MRRSVSRAWVITFALTIAFFAAFTCQQRSHHQATTAFSVPTAPQHFIGALALTATTPQRFEATASVRLDEFVRLSSATSRVAQPTRIRVALFQIYAPLNRRPPPSNS